MAIIGAILGDIAGSQYEFSRPNDLDWKHCELFTDSFIRNVLSLPCDTDTLCSIGGGIVEEFYGGTGFDNEALLRRYLDDRLYQIVKM